MTEKVPKARPVRRRRTIEERCRIVSESFEAGASVSEYASGEGHLFVSAAASMVHSGEVADR